MTSLRQEVLLDSNLFEDEDQTEIQMENYVANKDSKYKRKRNKKNKASKTRKTFATSSGETDKENEERSESDDIDIELVPEKIELDKNYQEFSKVFEHFSVSNE